MQTSTKSSDTRSLSGLLALVSDYNPFHREEQKIPLEATVEEFYEIMQPADSFRRKLAPHLVLSLIGPASSYQHIDYYSPLAFNLDSPLVQEIYELLKAGRTARFNGELVLATTPPISVVGRINIGHLKGELIIDNKKYSIHFVSAPSIGRYPLLKQITYKS